MSGFTTVKNNQIPAVVKCDNIEELTIVSQWCYQRILYCLKDPRLINTIYGRNGNEFLNTLNEHDTTLWSLDLYAFLHDFYFELDHLESLSGTQETTGSFVRDFELKTVIMWFRNRPERRYLLNLSHYSMQLNGHLANDDKKRLTLLFHSILYYHVVLQTCYAFRNRLMAMQMIHNDEDPDGTKEEFFNHPSHLATLHSLDGYFDFPLPQNHLETTQLDNLCRKMMDLKGNNQSPRFVWRNVKLIYEALEIHDPSVTLIMTAEDNQTHQTLRLDRIVNDVYRQSTLTLNGFRLV